MGDSREERAHDRGALAALLRKLVPAPRTVTPWRGPWISVLSRRLGEPFAFLYADPTGATVSEELSTNARTDEEKRGITIGILVVALLCLSLFFVWRHYGVPRSGAHQVAPSTR